ncbi:MAG: NCS2 family permease [Phycisphaerae bacterium]|nr:NCS2 family permease [Phycisphaerae bacterium]
MFKIRELGSTPAREVLGGVTTFMAMSYILFVQVDFLSGGAGMDAGGVIFATCVASAVGCVAMALLANYPVALAPGMGENAFFAFTMAGAMAAWNLGMPGWQPALALTMLAGVIFLALSFTGLRAMVVRSMPPALQFGVAAGIGLLIATVGLMDANVVAFTNGIPSAVPLDGNPAAWIALIGLAVLLALSALRVPGAVLITILLNAALAIFVFGILDEPETVFAGNVFAGVGETVRGGFAGFAGLGKALGGGHVLEMIALLVVLLFMDVFDTIGTLVGVGSQAGIMKDGKLPRVERALSADAIATSVGGALGTSTITSYVESATGVAAGARTGLSSLVVAGLMIVALFFRPLIELVGGGVTTAQGQANPMIAPALILVGALMLRAIREINWDDVTEYFPAFLTVVVMPLTLSISHGIGIGFISYAAGKLLTGRARQCPVVVYVVAGLFVLRYVLGGVAGIH